MRLPAAMPLAVLAVAGLAACTGSLLDSSLPAPEVYVLRAGVEAGGGIRGNHDVVVAEPAAAPGLSTDRIAVLHPDRRLEYFSGARWGDTAARVLQSLIVGTLQDQGAFRSVTAAPTGTAATHLVELELKDFQAEYTDGARAPVVRVSVVANVIGVADRRLVAVIPATALVQASENRLAAVVAAFESAARQVSADLGRQVGTALSSSAP